MFIAFVGNIVTVERKQEMSAQPTQKEDVSMRLSAWRPQEQPGSNELKQYNNNNGTQTAH